MTNSFGLLPNDIEDITHLLRQYTAVEEAILFGSRAKGNYKSGSDVDIALKGSQLTQRTIAAIADFFNEETLMPYHFDVINYHTIDNPQLVAHIDRVGVRFYAATAEISTAA
jgi:predicted nucleotidyltransferase